jgi:hypothetical protein
MPVPSEVVVVQCRVDGGSMQAVMGGMEVVRFQVVPRVYAWAGGHSAKPAR